MTRDRAAVVLADTEPWEAFTWLAAALRRQGFDTYRVTAPPGTRLQQLSSVIYRAAYTRTETSLRWAGGTAPVDVADVECVWQPNVVDVQAADRVGAALLDDPRWAQHPRLHRVPDPTAEPRLYDKLFQTEDAAAAGCPVPTTWTDPADVTTDRVVIKQRLGSGGDAVVIVDRNEIPYWQHHWHDQGGGLIYQQPVSGPTLNVGGIARDGQLVVAAAYETVQSPSDPQGPSVAIRTLDRPDLLAHADAYVRQVGYHGAICFDFIDDGGVGYLIDVNPRFFGSWAALQATGLPLVEAYVEYLRDQPVTVTARSTSGADQLTVPIPEGSRWQTMRAGIGLLDDFAGFAGARGWVSGLPSLARAVRAAGRQERAAGPE